MPLNPKHDERIVPASAMGPAVFRSTLALGLTVPLLLLLSLQGTAQIEYNGPIYFEDQDFVGTGCDREDEFGNALALCGDLLLVGAYRHDDLGEWSGAVFVYRLDGPSGTWIEEAKLLASDGSEYDNFGFAVALSESGDVAAIGSVLADTTGTNTGAVYIFRHDSLSDTWNEEAKLLASDGVGYDMLGHSVALQGDLLVAGAIGCDDSGNGSGAAYVFGFDAITGTWIEKDKLLASSGGDHDYLGFSIALSGDLLVVGACDYYNFWNVVGKAFVFRFDPVSGQWTEEAKLGPSDGDANDSFAGTLDIAGDMVLIGAPNHYHPNDIGGAVYVYRRDPASGLWEEIDELFSSDAYWNSRFGVSVAASGDLAVIGDWNTFGVKAWSHGGAYMFRYDSSAGKWIEEFKILPADGTSGDFGRSAAIAGGRVVIGAPHDDGNGYHTGSVWALDFSEGIDFRLDPCPMVAGQNVRFSVTGGEPSTDFI